MAERALAPPEPFPPRLLRDGRLAVRHLMHDADMDAWGIGERVIDDSDPLWQDWVRGLRLGDRVLLDWIRSRR